MTTSEFNSEFDILYNNISSNSAPGLDIYEKSVLLTQAQNTLVESLYKGNFAVDSFESTEEATRFLNELVKHESISPSSGSFSKIVANSTVFRLPLASDGTHTKVWFIIYSEVIDSANNKYMVQPVTHDKIFRELKNPFRNNSKWRMLGISKDNYIEVVHSSSITLSSLELRYIEKPSPIILENLNGIDTIDGINIKTECTLNPLLHRTILFNAVTLAKTLYTNNNPTASKDA